MASEYLNKTHVLFEKQHIKQFHRNIQVVNDKLK